MNGFFRADDGETFVTMRLVRALRGCSDGRNNTDGKFTRRERGVKKKKERKETNGERMFFMMSPFITRNKLKARNRRKFTMTDTQRAGGEIL